MRFDYRIFFTAPPKRDNLRIVLRFTPESSGPMLVAGRTIPIVHGYLYTGYWGCASQIGVPTVQLVAVRFSWEPPRTWMGVNYSVPQSAARFYCPAPACQGRTAHQVNGVMATAYLDGREVCEVTFHAELYPNRLEETERALTEFGRQMVEYAARVGVSAEGERTGSVDPSTLQNPGPRRIEL